MNSAVVLAWPFVCDVRWPGAIWSWSEGGHGRHGPQWPRVACSCHELPAV